jgi:hypothetical protein
MNKIILFFELGYIFNLCGLVILILYIKSRKHIEGVSIYTQWLFAYAALIKIFYFPFTILYEYWICWIEFFLSCILSFYLLYLLTKYKNLSMTREANYFDWRIIAVVSIIFAALSNYEKEEDWEWSQFIIRVSIITESIGLLPQLKLMKADKFVPKYFGYYLVSLSLSRICRIFFWFYQVRENYRNDTYYTLIFFDFLYLVLTCDFIYNFFKHRNCTLIPY